jgi:hypothetical protein
MFATYDFILLPTITPSLHHSNSNFFEYDEYCC